MEKDWRLNIRIALETIITQDAMGARLRMGMNQEKNQERIVEVPAKNAGIGRSPQNKEGKW